MWKTGGRWCEGTKSWSGSIYDCLSVFLFAPDTAPAEPAGLRSTLHLPWQKLGSLWEQKLVTFEWWQERDIYLSLKLSSRHPCDYIFPPFQNNVIICNKHLGWNILEQTCKLDCSSHFFSSNFTPIILSPNIFCLDPWPNLSPLQNAKVRQILKPLMWRTDWWKSPFLMQGI